MPLSDVRKRIDEVDKELKVLLEKRFDLSKEVAEIKIRENIPVLNNKREVEILEKIGESVRYPEQIKSVYTSIFESSRSLQHDMIEDSTQKVDVVKLSDNDLDSENCVVACYGTMGSYSNIAAKKLFKSRNHKFFDAFEKIFEAVSNGEADCGVIPIENSTAGSIHENYDLLRKYDLKIFSACTYPIHHCLLAKKGTKIEDIKTVYSHYQALSQTSEFIDAHGFNTVSNMSTAEAAKKVADSDDPTCAAIASAEAAEDFGLEILAMNVENVSNNTTRFVAVAKNCYKNPDADKISLMFTLPHTTGYLYKTLLKFAVSGLNLTKIESRPIPERDFEYYFYLDFKGNIHNEETRKVLRDMNADVDYMVFLGNYLEINF